MPKRRDRPLIEHLLDAASRIPWWVDGALATLFYLGLHVLYGHLAHAVSMTYTTVRPHGNPLESFDPAVHHALRHGCLLATTMVVGVLQYAMTGLFVLGSIVSVFREQIAAKR